MFFAKEKFVYALNSEHIKEEVVCTLLLILYARGGCMWCVYCNLDHTKEEIVLVSKEEIVLVAKEEIVFVAKEEFVYTW